MLTTCGLFVVRPDGKILIVHPTNHEWNQWDIPKGCFDIEDSSYETTAFREFEEECGINLFNENYIVEVYASNKFYKYPHREKRLIPFLVTINKDFDKLLVCNSMVKAGIKPYPFPEVDAFTWINYSQREALHITQIQALEDFQADLNLFEETENIKSHIYG